MPSQNVTLTAATGLHVQSNSYTVPDGSFELAENVVFSKDNIISKRRGFGALTPAFAVINPTGLVEYLGFLFVVQNNLISKIDTTTGALTDLSGAINISTNAKPRIARANGNLYIATADGIRKIESSTATVLQAGIPRGLDLDISTDPTVHTGILSANYAVGYRILFGRLDANSNKVVGAPGEISTRTNPFINGAIPATASNSGVAITVTYTAHGLNIGDVVTIANCNGTGIAPNGNWLIAGITANTFIFNATTAPTTITACDFGVPRTPLLEFTLPPEIGTQHFYQIYRTTQVPGATSPVSDDGALIYEANVTSAQVANKYISFTDNVAELFKDGYLYTNSSQQGIAKANFRPPSATDIAVFKNCLFFANTQTYHSLSLGLKDVQTATMTTGDYVEVTQAGNTRRYIANTTGPTAGFAGTSTLATWNYGYADTNGYFYFYLTNSTTTSVSTSITKTAKSLCKAINRDATSPVYGYYSSSADAVPGQFTLDSRTLSGTAFSLRASTTVVGNAFSPVFPTSFGTTATSSNSIQQNAVRFSKPSEPEAAPLPFQLLIGAKTSAILRIVPLRDAMLVIKTDGIYIIRGDSPSNFSASLLDSTIICVAPNSVQVLNNNVFFLSNQGIVSASDSGAQVISRSIEPLLTSIIGKSTIAIETNAVAYESERLYLLSTLNPNSTTASVVYCFNTVTNAFSTWTNTFKDALVNASDDRLYLVSNVTLDITKERKLQNKLDYCDLSFAGLSGVTTTGTFTAQLAFPSGSPSVSDVIYDNVIGTINPILSISTASGTPVYTFKNPISWSTGSALQLYKPIRSAVKTAPLTVGDVGKFKHFSEFTCTFRNRSASALTFNFANDSALSSIDTNWLQNATVQTGWGFNWGSLWGGDNIDSVLTTQGNQQARTYIPLEAARGTYIQASIVHSVAAENLEIQSLSYTVRPYSNRVSR